MEILVLVFLKQSLSPGWLSWRSWSSCSSTCDSGTITRRRSCSTENNRDCPGRSSQTSPCFLRNCPSKFNCNHFSVLYLKVIMLHLLLLRQYGPDGVVGLPVLDHVVPEQEQDAEHAVQETIEIVMEKQRIRKAAD